MINYSILVLKIIKNNGINHLSASLYVVYLIEVPHSERQSSPWRIMRFPLAVSVARDIQVHSVLNILLYLNGTKI